MGWDQGRGLEGTRDEHERDLGWSFRYQEWGQRSGDGDRSWEWSGNGAGGTRDGGQGVGTELERNRAGDMCTGTRTRMALVMGLGPPCASVLPHEGIDPTALLPPTL